MGEVTRTLIMAVPWVPVRAKSAVDLMRATEGEIVWDEKHDAMDTWRLVLSRAGSDSVIIIEDDVILTESWRERIEEVIADHAGDVIQFFSMRKADVEVGSRYEPGRTFMMNQCYYLPAGAAAELLDFSMGWDRDANGYDMCMADWMKSKGMKYWLHVPSLVQHLPWTSEIHPRRPKNRQSRTFQ